MKKPKRGRQWEDGFLFSLPVSDLHDPVKSGNKKSITDNVYLKLRNMILYDVIAPGSWLRQDILTKELGVSRTPVREALRALNREGLIELIPNYGAKVSDLSIDEFEEIYAMRKGIEGLAVRISVMKISLEKLIILRKMYDDLVPMANNSVLSNYLREEWHFRYWLYEIAVKERVLSQIRILRERAERYLRFAYTFEGSISESLEFHYQLLLSCERGNPSLAEKIVQKALDWTLETAAPLVANTLSSS